MEVYTYRRRQGTIIKDIYFWFDIDRKTRCTRSNDKRGWIMRRRVKDICICKETKLCKNYNILVLLIEFVFIIT